jgi:hypothetical protein
MENGVLELKCRTSIEEKINRFEHINGVFMDKYFQLVWFARSDEKKLLEEERYEILERLKEIAEKYKEEVQSLYGQSSDWTHGFNSGILAYSRFLSSYIEDQLWPVEDVGYTPKRSEITTFEGKKYVEMDGKQQAEQLFPELDT